MRRIQNAAGACRLAADGVGDAAVYGNQAFRRKYFYNFVDRIQCRHRKKTWRQSARAQTTNRKESTGPRARSTGVDNHERLCEEEALSHAPRSV